MGVVCMQAAVGCSRSKVHHGQEDCAKDCVARQSCRVCYMKTVAKLPGVTSLAMDVEKSTLTVVGEVDPVDIVQELKKVKKAAEIMTVGPPDKKPEEEEKKPLLECCHSCRKHWSLVEIVDDYGQPAPCTIM